MIGTGKQGSGDVPACRSPVRRRLASSVGGAPWSANQSSSCSCRGAAFVWRASRERRPLNDALIEGFDRGCSAPPERVRRGVCFGHQVPPELARPRYPKSGRPQRHLAAWQISTLPASSPAGREEIQLCEHVLGVPLHPTLHDLSTGKSTGQRPCKLPTVDVGGPDPSATGMPRAVQYSWTAFST